MSILNLGKATLIGISLLSPNIQIASLFIWTLLLTVNGRPCISHLKIDKTFCKRKSISYQIVPFTYENRYSYFIFNHMDPKYL